MKDKELTIEQSAGTTDNRPETINGKASDDKPKRSEFKIAVISGSCAIMGVLLGAIITGYFSIKSQSIIAQQQTAAFSRQLVQTERQELKKVLSDYIEVIFEYYQLMSNEKLSSREIDKFAKKANVAAFYITIVISLDLGQKTLEINQGLFQNLKAKSTNKYSENSDAKVLAKIMEWSALAKGELKLLEYKASPENLSTDLLRLLLKVGLPSSEGKR